MREPRPAPTGVDDGGAVLPGWYRVAGLRELAGRTSLAKRWIGIDVALLRSKRAEPYMVQQHCPHLGASFAAGGHVDGDCVVCPFHGWSFDARSGALARIPYSTRAVPRVAIRRWTTATHGESIYAWWPGETTDVPAPPWSGAETAGWTSLGPLSPRVVTLPAGPALTRRAVGALVERGRVEGEGPGWMNLVLEAGARPLRLTFAAVPNGAGHVELFTDVATRARGALRLASLLRTNQRRALVDIERWLGQVPA